MSRRRPVRAGRASQPWLIPTVALFVVLPIAGGVTYALTRDSAPDIDSRDGSVLVARGEEPLLPGDEPESYRITYEVTQRRGDTADRSTVTVTVRRPFESHVVSRAGDRMLGERASTLGRVGVRSSGEWRVIAVGPAPGTADLRPSHAIADAIDAGTVDARERRRVAGRECQVIRSGSTLSAGTLVPYDSDSASYADTCFDSEGLLLEEVWVLDGQRVERRVAVDVEVGVEVDNDEFATTGEPLPVGEGGGDYRPIADGSRNDGLFVLDAPPSGFRHLEQASVIGAQVSPTGDPSNPEAARTSLTVVDVYVRGADLLVVEQGRITGDIAPPAHAVSIEVPWGAASAFVDFRTSEVRGLLPTGDVLRIYGTLPIDELTALARRIHASAG